MDPLFALVISMIIVGLVCYLFYWCAKQYLYTQHVEYTKLIHEEGLPYVAKKSKIWFKQNFEDITIEDRIKIPLSRVNGSEVVYGTGLSTGDNSPLGRAAVGGLLFGGVGAIVGATSGTTTSTVTTPRYFLIINYTTKDGKEENLIFSGDAILKKDVMKISDYINSKVGYKPKYDPENIEL